MLPGFFHDTLGEKDRAIALDKARGFILARFAEPLNRPSLRDADRTGLHPRRGRRAGLALAAALAARALLGGDPGRHEAGRAARGRHQARSIAPASIPARRSTMSIATGRSGLGPLGRLIDRTYLHSIGWRGIRQREAPCRGADPRRDGAARGARACPCASSTSPPVTAATCWRRSPAPRSTPESILLRDYSDLNVEAGRRLIAEKGLGGVASFVPGDAFDRDSLAGIDPTADARHRLRPLRAVPGQRHGRPLARPGSPPAIPPGGCLVYTCQPWHPQLELIARVLTSHRQGQAWVMRRRSQAEMDQLVAAAGFRKIEQRIDEWGIFTVALAERIAPSA